jgi:hypothetical protein
MIMNLHRAANERPRFPQEDQEVGSRLISGLKRVPSTTVVEVEEEQDEEDELAAYGYSFFDSVSCHF